MLKRKSIRISVYDNGKLHTSTSMLANLIDMGYTNIELINNSYKLLDLYDYHIDTLPQIIIVDTEFINKNYNGLQALDDIKKQFKDIVIICLNDRDTLVDTLKSNCDSFVNKTSRDYVPTLRHTLTHWTQYIVERESLNELYASILI